MPLPPANAAPEPARRHALKTRNRGCHARRPRLDVLEARRLLAVFRVNTTADDVDADNLLTLREALHVLDNPILLDPGATPPPGFRLATAGERAQVVGTPGDNDAIVFDLPRGGPNHVYYTNLAAGTTRPVPTLAVDGVTPITTDAQLANPTLVGAGNTIDPSYPHSWWKIALTQASYPGLPLIRRPVTIDGFSQGQGTPDDARPNTLAEGNNAVLRVQLAAPSTPAIQHGLAIDGPNVTVRGLMFSGFAPLVIAPTTNTSVVTGATIQGNILGLDPSGTRSVGSGSLVVRYGGVHTIGMSGGGHSNAGQRNLIGQGISASDSSDNVIAGNIIGAPDAAGTFLGGYIRAGGVRYRIGTDGDGQGDLLERNVLESLFVGANDSVVAGNLIGLNVSGMTGSYEDPLLRGRQPALDVRGSRNRIGTNADGLADAAERNVIVGSYSGCVWLYGEGNVLAGNFIGTDASGTVAIDHGFGVLVGPGNTVGGLLPAQGNLIRGASVRARSDWMPGPPGTDILFWTPGTPGTGVMITGPAAVLGNRIVGNGGLGIDRLQGSNIEAVGTVDVNDAGDLDGRQNYPVLTSLAADGAGQATLAGTLSTLASTSFRIEVFAGAAPDATGHGEGETFVGFVNVTTDAAGQASFTLSFPVDPARPVVSATATRLDAVGKPISTSEFARDLRLGNTSPTVAYTVTGALEGVATTFNATGTTDPDGDPMDYLWDFGDGTMGRGATVTHLFPDGGTYLVTLTVRDLGASAVTTQFPVTIASAGPVLSLTSLLSSSPSSPFGMPVVSYEQVFQLGAVDAPADLAAGIQVAWNVTRDGQTTASGSGVLAAGQASFPIRYMPDAVGTYVVTVTATDKDGAATTIQQSRVIEYASGTGNNDLFVGGTTGDDVISVMTLAESMTTEVTINGVLVGTFDYFERVMIRGAAGNDTITADALIGSWSGRNSVTIDGQQGSDTYVVPFGGLFIALVITDTGTSGTDRLQALGNAEDETISKYEYQGWLHVDRSSPTNFQSVMAQGIEAILIDGGAGTDTIIDPGENTTLRGGAGNDTIIIDATTGNGVLADGGDGSDTYVIPFGNLLGPVTVSDSGNGGTDTVSIVGTTGADAFVVGGNTVSLGGQTVNLNTSVESLAIDGGGGNDALTVTQPPAVPPTATGVGRQVVTGTGGNDNIDIRPRSGDGRVVIVVNSVVTAVFVPTSPVVVYGLAGDDNISVSGGVAAPVWLDGGVGNDRLRGGDGHDVLIGGAGADLIVGGGGRDLLLGGLGADRLVGNADDDILIAGYTEYDANDAALAAILAEWSSSRSYAERIRNLSADVSSPSFSARANGEFFLLADPRDARAATVFDDGDADVLSGSSGMDWFLANLDGDNRAKKDQILDLDAGEFASDLDFINGSP